jgi:hypothetical protein
MPILGVVASSRQVAVPDAGAMFPLQVVTVGGSGAASVSFTNIPNTYAHLHLRSIILNSAAATGDVWIRFNSDTGNNYKNHYLYGNGGSIFGGPGGRTDVMYAAFGGSTISPGASVMDILDYANTNKNTTIRALMGHERNDGVSGDLALTSGVWLNTNAVTSINIFPNSGSFAPNARFALYGVKSA